MAPGQRAMSKGGTVGLINVYVMVIFLRKEQASNEAEIIQSREPNNIREEENTLNWIQDLLI